jgi:hypothetical protein
MDSFINELISIAPTENEVQSIIHPQIRFKRNSINILIGRTGSGKTYSVLREISKICLIKKEASERNISISSLDEFHLIYYITDKDFDATFSKFKSVITIPIVFVKYDEADSVLDTLSRAKAAYDEVVENGWENQLNDASVNEILNPLHVNDFEQKDLQTLVILDDCLRIFDSKKNPIHKRLYENRQPKITYFLTLHDLFSIPPSLKTNLHTLWIFGGFNKQKINTVYPQLNINIEREEFWEKYKELSFHESVIIYYEDDGTKMEIISE